VADLTPSIDYAGVTLVGVERLENPNYLFVNLRIAPETVPGTLRIDFRKGRAKVASRSYELQARAPGSATRAGFGPRDVMYLVMPDRFANGDPSNDTVSGLPDGLQRSQPLGRHGGDLQGLSNHLDYVAGMGFTQLWLNPVLENDQPEFSYHGYAITDFYKVDPRLGSNESYRKLVADARARGIGMIQDVVLNHAGSSHWWMRDLPCRDWLSNNNTFVPTEHIREALQDPNAAKVDSENYVQGWFVKSMPDLNQRNPFMATYLIQNTLWWVEYAGLSGLRIDTYGYSDKAFLTEWSRRVTEEYPNLGIVGEEWSGSPVTVSYWQRGQKLSDGYVSYLPTLFDFPLQEAVSAAMLEKEDWGTGMRRIYRTLSYDRVYPDPSQLVVFPDNHDVSRIFTVLNERVDLTKMAIAFFLTTRGTPQIFYGTEILMSNKGSNDHGVIRSDFPGGWAGDAKNAFTGTGLSEPERDMQQYMRSLLQWRRTAAALHDGKLTQYAPMGGIYVYFRRNASQTVMVVLNHNDESKQLDTKRFAESIGTATTGNDVLTGTAHTLTGGLTLPPRSATILELR
jgi:glycosidase